MKARIIFWGLMFLFISQNSVNAQPYVTLQHNGTATFYTSVTAAINAATNKDTIIIPGGNFNIGTLTINKRLVIYGAGHYPDSSTAMTRTVLEGDIKLVSGADSGMIQGFYLTGDVRFGTSSSNQVVNGYVISRVNIDTLELGFSVPTTSSGIIISESVIRGKANGCNASNVVVEKCIFDKNLFYFKNTVFTNNIFHYNGYGYYGYTTVFHTGISYCTFNNNFIKQSNNYGYLFGGCDNCIFNNNAFEYYNVALPSGTNSGTNNYWNIYFSNHFENLTSSESFNYANNYNLKSTSSVKGKGTDGKDIGIYGTQFPYKGGAVPENPHFMKIVIPTQNDASGKLNIQVKVRAEER